jgi:hypothetical protein
MEKYSIVLVLKTRKIDLDQEENAATVAKSFRVSRLAVPVNLVFFDVPRDDAVPGPPAVGQFYEQEPSDLDD